MFQRILFLASFLILTGCDTSVEMLNILAGKIEFADGKGVFTADHFNFIDNREENYVLQKDDFIADITYNENDGLIFLHEDEQISLDNGQLGFFYSVPKFDMTFNELIHNGQNSNVKSLSVFTQNQEENEIKIKDLNIHCKGKINNIIERCLKLGKLSIQKISISTKEQDPFGDDPFRPPLKRTNKYKKIKAHIRNGRIRISLKAVVNATIMAKGTFDAEKNVLTVQIISGEAGMFNIKDAILKSFRNASENLLERLSVEDDTISLQF